MPRKREIPFAPIPMAGRQQSARLTEIGRRTDDDVSDLEALLGGNTPATEIQALMECAPGEEPQWSKERLLPLRDLILDAYDQLDDEEQWVLDAVLIEHKSVRALAAEVNTSKTRVDRIKHRALVKLQVLLIDRPQIQEFLKR